MLLLLQFDRLQGLRSKLLSLDCSTIETEQELFLLTADGRRCVEGKLSTMENFKHNGQALFTRVSTYTSPVNCWWSSPAKSFLILDLVGTYNQYFVRSKTVYIFENWAPSSTTGRVGLLELGPQLLLECSCTHTESG